MAFPFKVCYILPDAGLTILQQAGCMIKCCLCCSWHLVSWQHAMLHSHIKNAEACAPTRSLEKALERTQVMLNSTGHLDESAASQQEQDNVCAVLKEADHPTYWVSASKDGNRESHYRGLTSATFISSGTQTVLRLLGLSCKLDQPDCSSHQGISCSAEVSPGLTLPGSFAIDTVHDRMWSAAKEVTCRSTGCIARRMVLCYNNQNRWHAMQALLLVVLWWQSCIQAT